MGIRENFKIIEVRIFPSQILRRKIGVKPKGWTPFGSTLFYVTLLTLTLIDNHDWFNAVVVFWDLENFESQKINNILCFCTGKSVGSCPNDAEFFLQRLIEFRAHFLHQTVTKVEKFEMFMSVFARNFTSIQWSIQF